MSGPVDTEDAPAEPGEGSATPEPTIEITESHAAQVGSMAVRRALPRRPRRTVGSWCFADHMGPAAVAATGDAGIGPHPHTGLQTVTWLLAGELLHRDSLGSEQTIRPGQLNLMTAGDGVSHAEEGRTAAGRDLHGIQLWVAQPERTRHDPPAFEHHAELPRVELDHGDATVLVGESSGVASPARRDTEHLGVDLALRPGTTTLPLRSEHEHALIVLAGAVRVVGEIVTPGHLGYLGTHREELALEVTEPTRALLLGGEPFESKILMWWNFVARTREEVDRARDEWQEENDRFGDPRSVLDRIPAPVPPWRS